MRSSLALAALFVSTLAWADEPAPLAAAAAPPAPDAAAEAPAADAPAADAPAADAPAAEAPAADDEVPVTVSIHSVATLDRVPAHGLKLATCAAPHGDPERGAPAGAVVFELRVRRGKVAMVTVASADPGVAAFGPCFERELTAWQWPVRRDDLRVTVQVGEATAAAP